MTGFRVRDRGRVDRSRPIGFSFDGQPYSGFAGDSLASALMANGVMVVGRSFKYHRPRGLLASGSEEPNALVAVDRGNSRSEPNTRATMQGLFDGLQATSQNRWPNLRYDLGALSDLVHAVIPAGFYYKTFLWPKSFWGRFYEPLIRRAAGLGRSPATKDPESYTARYAHCEVLIVGAGAAGIAAAISASDSGLRTILVDEHAEPGGWILSDPAAAIEGEPAADWLAAARRELAARPNVKVLVRTTAAAAYQANMIVLAERLSDHLAVPAPGLPRERLWRVRARHVVLATGTTERPVVFAGNDRPGILLAGAAQTLLNRYGVAVGRRPVIVTRDDSAWATAFELASAGVAVVAIVDLRYQVQGGLVARARDFGIAVHLGSAITGTRGRHGVRSVDVSSAGDTAMRSISCDAVLMCGGWSPNVHLFSQSRGTLAWHGGLEAYVAGEPRGQVTTAGAVNGIFGLAEAAADGSAAGARAAAGSNPGRPAMHRQAPRVPEQPVPHSGRAFVDFQNDVTADDLRLAVREGFRSVEHVKRYTTVGMATDQGRTSNANALAVTAAALRRSVPEIGITTYRPPYTPTTFGALAGHAGGEFFAPARDTPTAEWARAQGAVFEPVGLWRRARYFPRSGEDMAAAVSRECLAVRASLGICDVSTLGKIAVVGPDALEFLNRVYVNDFSRLEPGRCRYAVLLGEDGFIMDDGIVARLSADAFHVTTTTSGADRVLHLMEDYRQTEWPHLDVWLTSVTEQWGAIGINGPNARRLIEPLVEDMDLAPSAMPHMSVREGRIGDIPVRLFRVSFTGELGFELNVPAGATADVWRLLVERGESLGISPYGTESMHVLRAEKGYIVVGHDTDGTVTPDDAWLGWMIGKSKSDFIGKRSLSLAAMCRPDRKQLVGLLTRDPTIVLEEGAQITERADEKIPMTMIGHVTSSYWSPALGRSIAMALVRGGRQHTGATLYVPVPGATHAVTVASSVFLDPENARLRG